MKSAGRRRLRLAADLCTWPRRIAAKASGESTWRIVFGELMPNMISRIAAAFVLVFYIALLTDAGLEFPRARRHVEDELGKDSFYWYRDFIASRPRAPRPSPIVTG